MASFISRILNSLAGNRTEAEFSQRRGQPVEYENLVIQAAPVSEGRQWRLAGVIIKESSEGEMERTFTRADLYSTREEAENYSIRKGKQIINEQGSRLFEDGEKTGRA